MAISAQLTKEQLRGTAAVAANEVYEGVRSKSVRLNLLLPAQSAERLDKLKDLTEASSYTEVIRSAIRIYEAIIQEYEKGNRMQFLDKGGQPLGITIF